MAETTTLAHLSDLHFGRHDPSVVASIVAELTARRPDLVVISGDLTQRARHGEFLAARHFIERLPVQALVVPGNHDVAAWNVVYRFVAPLRRYRRYITDDLQPAWENRHVHVVGINTTRRAGPYADWSRGGISRARLHALRRHLDAVDHRKIKILVTHHSFAWKPDRGRSRPVVDTPPECLDVLAGCGVRVILSGHFHHGYATVLQARDGTCIRAVQAGTTTSRRLKGEPNSFNWVAVSPHPARCISAETVQLQPNLTWVGTGRDSAVDR